MKHYYITTEPPMILSDEAMINLIKERIEQAVVIRDNYVIQLQNNRQSI